MQLPLAMPSILAGVNQTIMMALGIVVIAALIGAGGLGHEVLVSLQRLRVGQALEAGLAIVFLAIILDRISHGYSQDKRYTLLPGFLKPRGPNQGAPPALMTYVYWATALLMILYVMVVDAYVVDLSHFPASWQLSIRAPVDNVVYWMRDNLYQIGELPIGTGPLSDFLTIWLLNPLRSLLQDWLPWPVVILGVAFISYLVGGLAVGALLGDSDVCRWSAWSLVAYHGYT